MKANKMAKAAATLLTELNGGQGFAQMSCHYDSASGEPEFGITVYRERDGATYGPKEGLTLDEFVTALERLATED